MPSPSSEFSDIDSTRQLEPERPLVLSDEPLYPVVRPRERRLKHLVLFLLTVVTTALAGADFYGGFVFELGRGAAAPTLPELLINGFWYGVPALSILGAHEFGHYFACRYYGVRASLPYFLPLWIPVPLPQFGTLGAVIRIREPITRKKQLFDIGIAGPLAGFVVLVPVLLLGLSLSHVVAMPPDFRGVEFGEPLLFRFVSWVRFGPIPDGYTVNLHPVGWAAWFGMLATALNLTPIGQLDGGHISYAVLGRKSGIVTVAAAVGLVSLTIASQGAYALWTMIVIAMLFVFGLHHPRALDEHEPLDRARVALAIVAAAIFILSFTPIPMTVIGLE